MHALLGLFALALLSPTQALTLFSAEGYSWPTLPAWPSQQKLPWPSWSSKRTNAAKATTGSTRHTSEVANVRRYIQHEYAYDPWAQPVWNSSFPLAPLAVHDAVSDTAWVTMCIVGEHGASDDPAICLESLCTLRRQVDFGKQPVIVMVNERAREEIGRQLRDKGAHVVVVPHLQWASTGLNYQPSAEGRSRLYTYLKLHAWRLTQFKRIFWFDSDIWFVRDPQVIVDTYASSPQQVVATAFSVEHFRSVLQDDGVYRNVIPSWWDDENDVYWNSGVMLFQPSLKAYADLVAIWANGKYQEWTVQPTEQDVLRVAVAEDGPLGPLAKMDVCYNYRGYSDVHEHCDKSKLILVHNSDAFQTMKCGT